VLNKTIRLLNFDYSITKQKRLLSQYPVDILDLSNFGPQARHWMTARIRKVIEEKIRNSTKNSITFIGSGDFHHISEILISQFEEPLCVISFDFHPDWAILSPRLGCGSWVNEVLKKRNVLKFIMFGVSSTDISSFDIQTGNINSLRDNRVEIYPYAHRPTCTFLKKIPENISVKIEDGLLFRKIYWDELKDKNLTDFLQTLLDRLPQKKVYITIDKDCLKSNFALTNWEEGMFSLEELLLLLKLIKQNTEIVGLDIVGDYSDVLIKGRLRKIISYWDHPRKIRASRFQESLITSINEETNLKILQLLNTA
jgi:hypothetical protein